MLTDWIHWFSSIPSDRLLIILLPVLLFDTVRYCVGAVIMLSLTFVSTRGDHCAAYRKRHLSITAHPSV